MTPPSGSAESEEIMDALSLFQPVVARWFAESFAEPTPAQRLGWPRIAKGEHTLILAPTGSGKTLAAFLYALNELVEGGGRAKERFGVHTLYVSPLRALAADIERNLDAPLRGIRECGAEMGIDVGDVRVALRTGDTPAAERQRMVRRPPDVLITTPESLHLLLTSVRAREMLRTVRYVIVDEIHAVSTSKRGSFLALLLERIEALCAAPPVRIGLSATQRPLDRIARFLGGRDESGEPRAVAVVDAGMRKDLDLAVVSPVADMTRLPTDEGNQPTIWPAIFDRLVDWVDENSSTLVFANNRRTVERIAAEMNRRIGHDAVRAHHGSVAKTYRQEIERDLKAGRLPALVATSSLELGIDMGSIDLVCQVETPPSVASALQRVGRAGHVYRETSVGRMLPKTREDLWRMAAMARAMRRGDVSEITIPRNPLDVLAQQLVAMVAMDDWDADLLFARIRRAEPFHDLPRGSYEGVLEMISGRYSSPLFPGLRARVSWERATNVVRALPGARHAAILSGGTIPDTAQYPMVLEDGTRLGELDEEFVFERRVGDAFVLGTGRWRILEIRHDRVVVRPSDEAEAQMPFWKGEGLGHDAEFGERLGGFTRECEAHAAAGDLAGWLMADCALDAAAAENLSRYVHDQLAEGALPSDRLVLVDVFPNEVGEPRIAIISPFGRSFHLALWLVLRRAIRTAGGDPPEAVFSNAGILVRPGALGVEAVLAALRSLTDVDVARSIVEETETTPYFALRFRRNAARALLLPRSRPGKRTPLWLQRLRSHDLLEYASRHPRFPLVAETHREIVEDDLPVPFLERFLERVRRGEAELAVRRGRAPTPFAASLVFDFVGRYLYEADEPARGPAGPAAERDAVADLLHAVPAGALLVSAKAARTMEERLQGLSPFHRARDGAEAVELLRRLGGLTERELVERCEPGAAAAVPMLRESGRIAVVAGPGEDLLVAAEDASLDEEGDEEGVRSLVRRYIEGHAGRTKDEVLARFPWAAEAAASALASALASGRVVTADVPGRQGAFVDRDVLLGMRRLTLAARRREPAPVSLDRLAAAVQRRQHVTAPVAGPDGLREVLGQLAGWVLPMPIWHEVLRARVTGYRESDLDVLVRGGGVVWRGVRSGGRRGVAFSGAEAAALLLPAPMPEAPSDLAGRVLSVLHGQGASFLMTMAAALGEASWKVDEALWELTWLGRVTNDSLAMAVRPRPKPAATPARTAGRPVVAGRWSVTPAPERRSEEDTARLLRLALSRTRVLCRETLERDPVGVRWSEAYGLLSRMEWRGDVDRGVFVSGLSGPQFVAPGAGGELAGERGEDGPILLGTCDPANLCGDVVPVVRPNGDRYSVRRLPGNSIVFRAGVPILAVEAHGARLVPLVDLDAAGRRSAFSLLAELVRHAGQRAAVCIETWDGTAVSDTSAADDLASVGFIREDRTMILYRDFGMGR